MYVVQGFPYACCTGFYVDHDWFAIMNFNELRSNFCWLLTLKFIFAGESARWRQTIFNLFFMRIIITPGIVAWLEIRFLFGPKSTNIGFAAESVGFEAFQIRRGCMPAALHKFTFFARSLQASRLLVLQFLLL